MPTTHRPRATLALAFASTLAALCGCDTMPPPPDIASANIASTDIAAHAYRFHSVLHRGDTVSAFGGGTVTDFIPTAIDARGDVLIDALVKDTSGTVLDDLFEARGDRLIPVLAQGQPAPGGGTFFFMPVEPRFNDQGDAAIVDLRNGNDSSPFGIDAGVYRWDGRRERLEAVEVPGVTLDPNGRPFLGSRSNVSIDDLGRVTFSGIISTDQGRDGHIGDGLFRRQLDGRIVDVVESGDAGPGGSRFDIMSDSNANTFGEVAFIGHLAGDPCDLPAGIPPDPLGCPPSVFLRTFTGEVIALAHRGDPAPGGGVIQDGFNVQINNRREVAFLVDLGDRANIGKAQVLFRYADGVVTPIVRPGDAMPGGGHLTTVGSLNFGNLGINDAGDISFIAVLDSASNGVADTGLYLWSHGVVHLIARSGSVLPGIGTITSLLPDIDASDNGARINRFGQVAFSATLADGGAAIVVATPARHGE